MDSRDIDVGYCDTWLCYDGKNGACRAIGMMLSLVIDDYARGRELRYRRHLTLW